MKKIINFAFITFMCLLTLNSCGNKLNDVLYPFDSGVGRGKWSIEKQASELKKNGYKGIAYNYTTVEETAERVRIMEENNLQIQSFYIRTYIGAPEEKQFDKDVYEKVCQIIKGKNIKLWITMNWAKGTKPELGTRDDEAVSIVRKVASIAEKYGVEVVLYGHVNCYIETVEDSYRIAKKVDRKNVFCSFNVCHELLKGKGDMLFDNINKYVKYCKLVSINGADFATKRWILPLYEGDLDMVKVVKAIRDAGFTGPISQQCYSVKVAPEIALEKNMKKWKEIISEID